jgi:octanoyl-[GcvH]:protein N-octanoyltransferase
MNLADETQTACGCDDMASQLVWPQSLRLLDRFVGRDGSTDIAHSFALDELLCRRVGEGAEPLVHVWRHPRAFVLGLRDRRLPQAAEAMDWLTGLGYDVLVRNSGGAAVPLDPGVVNISLILPNPTRSLAFRRDFLYMAELVQAALASSGYAVAAGEIGGAYCPGDYDLSIAGRKFCGIAQRRQAKAFVVQGFIVAEGSGAQRARLVRQFYERAAGDRAEPGVAYPLVHPETMASLTELGVAGGADGFCEGVLQALKSKGPLRLLGDAGIPGDQLEAMGQSLRSRYDR